MGRSIVVVGRARKENDTATAGNPWFKSKYV
jgi:hypothetical protein